MIGTLRTDLVSHLVLLGRGYRLLRRQPIAIMIMIVQPMVWLLLYSQLFGALPRLGGFGTDSYLQFLTPGVAIMTAFNHGAWEGGAVVQDIERGAIDRFLATPLPSGALLVSRAVQAAIIGTLQALFVLGVAVVLGVDLAGGVPGLLAALVAAALVSWVFATANHGLALIFRRQETMTAVGLFTVLPLMFTSVAFMSASQLPDWMQRVAAANPVNWAIEAARSGMFGAVGMPVVSRLAALAALAFVTQAFALFALGRYRRTL